MSVEAPAVRSAVTDAHPLGPDGVAEVFRICAPLSLGSIVGAPVRDSNGKTIGFIETVMTDLSTGRIAYAVLKLGRRWQLRRRLHPVPWQSLCFVRDRKGIAARLDLASCGDNGECPEIVVVWPDGGGAAEIRKRAPIVQLALGSRLPATETGEAR